MNVRVSMSAVGLSIKETEGKEGQKFYRISIDQEGEAGALPLSDEAYKSIATTFKKYSPVVLNCVYNDQYKSLRVIGVSQR